MNQIAHQAPSIPGMWPYDADIFGEGEGTPRSRALSVIFAASASSFTNVLAFRIGHLGGKLLPADGVEAWVNGMAAQEVQDKKKRASLWLAEIPLDDLLAIADGSYIIPKSLIDAASRTDRSSLAPSLSRRELVYAVPAYPYPSTERFAPVLAHGVLDDLRYIASDLAETYKLGVHQPWTPACAATFVLTGYAPLIPAGQVAEVKPLPAGPGRRQTEKHLQLAAFTAIHEANNETLAERLELWNARYPQWRYKNTTNFGWDSRQALRRLESGGSAASEEPQEEPQPPSDEDWAIALLEQHTQARERGEEESGVWAAEVPQLAEQAQARHARLTPAKQRPSRAKQAKQLEGAPGAKGDQETTLRREIAASQAEQEARDRQGREARDHPAAG